MKKYIGIRGHRGAGKNTISYLLGQTINLVLSSSKLTEDQRRGLFNSLYDQWCKDFIDNEDMQVSLRYVYFDSFGDTPKMLVSLLTNIPTEYIYSDYYKDHCIINLENFSYQIISDDVFPESLHKADEVIKIVKSNKSVAGIEMTLREFIIYYATVTSMFLGKDVWIKSKRADDERMSEFDISNGDQYVIFTDIKAPSEVTYIKEKDGVIIKVDRPKNKKKNKGIDSLENDDRFDYNIVIEDLFKLKDEIYNIACKIIIRL